jgi:hypothetical protein
MRGADTMPRACRGYDNEEKVNGRRRHIGVDTDGLLLVVLVTMAGIQDRDGRLRRLGTAADSVSTGAALSSATRPELLDVRSLA